MTVAKLTLASSAFLLTVLIAAPAAAECDAQCGDPCHGSCSVNPPDSSPCGTSCTGGACGTLTCQEYGEPGTCNHQATWDCEEAGGGGGGNPLEKNPSPPLTVAPPWSQPTGWAVLEYPAAGALVMSDEVRVLAASSERFGGLATERLIRREALQRRAAAEDHAERGLPALEVAPSLRVAFWFEPPRGTCARLEMELVDRELMPRSESRRGVVLLEVTIDRGGRVAAVEPLYATLPDLVPALAEHLRGDAWFTNVSGQPGPFQVFVAFTFSGEGPPGYLYAGARQLL